MMSSKKRTLCTIESFNTDFFIESCFTGNLRRAKMYFNKIPEESLKHIDFHNIALMACKKGKPTVD